MHFFEFHLLGGADGGGYVEWSPSFFSRGCKVFFSTEMSGHDLSEAAEKMFFFSKRCNLGSTLVKF